jgi:2-hydroxyethylphosphonate dioxygenase
MTVDPFKVAHWTNARKYTAAQLAQRAGIALEQFELLLSDRAGEVGEAVVTAVAAALDVTPAQLAGDGARDLTVVCQSASAMYESRRPIQRDGIHFYNYFTMAAPPGRVAPVILDILCPPDRLPALNNGHLEPAITVNLGPGDIYGRWGTELSPDTWQVLHANREGDRWITGESYVEPSYCPHSYSLVSESPARIVSYTGYSNLAPLIEEVNAWSPDAFTRCADLLDGGLGVESLLDLMLRARGHDRSSAANALGIAPTDVDAAVADPIGGIDTLRVLGREIGFDYRVLLPAERRHDPVGKTCMSVEQSRASLRSVGGYKIASMASAPHLPDLIGLFVRVAADVTAPHGQMVEPSESHYLVVEGQPTLEWTTGPDAPLASTAEGGGGTGTMKFEVDGSAWVGPFVRHRWYGEGAVLKLSSGAHLGYLDLTELTNTYGPGATVRRGRRDLTSWGYD